MYGAQTAIKNSKLEESLRDAHKEGLDESMEAIAVDLQLRRSGRERKSVVPFYNVAAAEMNLDEDEKEGWQTTITCPRQGLRLGPTVIDTR